MRSRYLWIIAVSTGRILPKSNNTDPSEKGRTDALITK